MAPAAVARCGSEDAADAVDAVDVADAADAGMPLPAGLESNRELVMEVVTADTGGAT